MRALLFLLHVAVTPLKRAGDAIVSALWYFNVCGAIMARVLFGATELESSGVQPCKVTRNWVQKPCLF